MFATPEYYKTEFLRGRPPVIPIEQAEFWLVEASSAINFKNIPDEELEYLFDTISDSTFDKLQRATCRIAEILYVAEQAAGAPREGVKRSESVGNYSVSWESQRRTDNEVQREIVSTARKWLSNTALHNAFIYRN